MPAQFHTRVRAELDSIDQQGLTKPERVIASRQGPVITVAGREVLNFCANNYLGLGGDERVARAGIAATERWGSGTASVRFICGTLEIHKELEAAIAGYLGFEDAILFAAAFDANGGLFEPLFGEEDAIVSDSLNHASIIDGVRLCKAKRYRFANSDMDELEAKLKEARGAGARDIIIATDGAFSMDGYIARLQDIRVLADRYDALIMVDDCHATGFLGEKGRGSYAHHGVKVDFVTGTFGKALGGAMGGFICATTEVVQLLKQRARPYLFSNALAPAVCGSSLEAIRIAQGEEGDALRKQLTANAARFRGAMTEAGFDLLPGEHPIIPVMLGDAKLAQDFAARMLELGVYVIGFSFPVVPRGAARIRTQMSAAHTFEHIDQAVEAFTTAGRELGVI
ncbi:glycine C-acetyltransferase [Brevundimonas sp. BAL450]|jgi:glycine C-acetyltransferase|uniref:2-amino-3-ketobutyrate coenzyme A ligase n=1 Tax=Brevundimonas abyssalis TAR-001 TaxID=1391729 RepID=A0A8E0N916_9CAUL|nr:MULTISPECIES: glycine C-acetyltransferase [Brevundimonas]MBG7615384.1 glycine C-acetyltransferase [Brevundimonas sp. BAL450]GAD59174.1 2-amino-3-ketobutyrate coenzyme A ligase [Brevundimonas abyssalis TAR-001]